MMMLHTTCKRMALVLATWVLQGCVSVEPVQPWQKGTLAKPEMTFDDDLLDKSFKEHTYSSKESSSGGMSVGGGGCGCN